MFDFIVCCSRTVRACEWTFEDSHAQVKAFNKEFLPTDNGQLFELILAANYLNIKSLLDITCQAVAEQIRGKTPQQIRENFGIEVCFGSAIACLAASYSSWVELWCHCGMTAYTRPTHESVAC